MLCKPVLWGDTASSGIFSITFAFCATIATARHDTMATMLLLPHVSVWTCLPAGAIQKLLHFAVSDVSDDVRRAAVINLGFVLLNVPEQTPRIVSLLVRSISLISPWRALQHRPRSHPSCFDVLTADTRSLDLLC